MPLPGPVATTKTGCKGQCCVEPVRATWPFVACSRLASTSFACQFHCSHPILPQLFRVKAGGLDGLDWQTQLAMQTVKTSTTTHESYTYRYSEPKYLHHMTSCVDTSAHNSGFKANALHASQAAGLVIQSLASSSAGEVDSWRLTSSCRFWG